MNTNSNNSSFNEELYKEMLSEAPDEYQECIIEEIWERTLNTMFDI